MFAKSNRSPLPADTATFKKSGCFTEFGSSYLDVHMVFVFVVVIIITQARFASRRVVEFRKDRIVWIPIDDLSLDFALRPADWLRFEGEAVSPPVRTGSARLNRTPEAFVDRPHIRLNVVY